MSKLAALLLALAVPAHAQHAYDLVVYGASAGGVTTAISGARHGLKTVLIEPGRHVGGMSTGGLSRTDVGKREVIGGMALEFYQLVGDRYEMRRYNQPVAWFYEPRVGEAVMRQWLKDSGVTVLFGHRLEEKDGVVKDGARVVEIVTEGGARFRGSVFADCSYEGDLMAQAKVSYTWGREAVSEYGEALAGVRDRTPLHQFMVDVPARDQSGAVLPEVSTGPPGEPGTADRSIQAYNFRVIATDDPANRIPWPKPDGYTSARYALLARLLEATTAQKGRAPIFNEVALIARLPNHKADINNNGAFSTDYIGKNHGYPKGSYRRRAGIWQEHVAEASNLLVPVAFSASHVAYSSLRMEPQYMINGHAAGVAAWLALRDLRPVQAIDVAELQAILKKEAAVFEYVPHPQQEALRILRNKYAPKPPAPFNWE